MEIILRQDVDKLGYTHDIVKVKDGYARNFLIPKGWAIMATESNKKVLAETLKQKAHKESKIRSEAEATAKVLDGITVKIGAKASEKGTIFGSVNTIQVAQALKEQFHADIDRKNIALAEDHIKELGTYQAQIKLHKEVKVQINLDVVAE
jgi:large subunit ribosomal protein L9